MQHMESWLQHTNSTSSSPTQVLHSMWNLSSPIRDRTAVACIARQILKQWTTRDIPAGAFCSPCNSSKSLGALGGALRDLELSRIHTKLLAADFSQTRHASYREASTEPWQVSSPLTSVGETLQSSNQWLPPNYPSKGCRRRLGF